tara:strand:- start:34 stop:1038 length:1005 start_codon:yes stop_codon:yes gene_type:complete
MAYTTIDDPSAYFQTTLYTGNGGTQSITNTGNSDLQPDWVWTKGRGDTYSHMLYDSVRGATKELNSHLAAAETTVTNSLTSFNSDGFTLGSFGESNDNSQSYVAWNWKKVAGVFDIVTYAGNNTGSRQVSHNLGVVPSLIIIKNRTNASSWWVGSTEIPFTWNTDYLQLNETAAKGTDGGGHIFGAVPTSSYFVPGDNNDTNGNSNNYVAYLFGNKQGVSKVGSYEGNNNANGTFVYTGFSVGWVMIKNIDAGSTAWVIQDSKRSSSGGGNQADKRLRANANNAEETDSPVDLLSNGFKIRSTGSFTSDANTFIYMAFSENPFVTSGGVPATAR